MTINNEVKIAIIGANARSICDFRGKLIGELKKRGAIVFALAPDYDDRTWKSLTDLGAIPVSTPLNRNGHNPFIDFFNFVLLIITLRRIKPNITLAYFMKPVIFGTIAAWIARIPNRYAMIEGLGYYFTVGFGRDNLKKIIVRNLISILYKFSLARATKSIFLNSDDIQLFVRRGIVQSRNAVKLGGIGVDLDEWKYSMPNSKLLRFIFIGRLLREKGFIEYVSAARLIKANFPEVEFIVLGSEDSNPGAISNFMVKSFVEDGLISWHGWVPVKKWLETSSVFVLPSYREGVPRSTQEAMAVGRAIITTDVPGCRDTVINGVNGILIPPMDIMALANAMLHFIDNPEDVIAMGIESRKIAQKSFDVCRANKKLLTIMNLV